MSRVVITEATERRILELLEELDSLIEADEEAIFLVQHIDMVEEIKERLESSERIEGEYYVV